MLSKLTYLLALLFPILLWVCYRLGLPLWLGGLLLIPLAFRKHALLGWAFGAIAALLGLGALVFRAGDALLYYPVLINAAFLVAFAYTVLKPPTIIERLARKMEPDFPPEAIVYTRRVTLAWCLFFFCNGAIALWTTTLTMDAWMLYNGLIAYVAMGVMFGGEFLIRALMKKRKQ
jgi:uncharacterized membrane protein